MAKVDADEGSVLLSWDAPTDALSYKLAYYTLPNGMKTEKSILEPTFLLLQQPEGYKYRWEVKSVCQQGQSRTLTSEFELKEKPKEEAWISDPNLTYTPDSPIEPNPEVMQTTESEQQTKEPEVDIDALLNMPTKIYIPADGKELPEGLPEPIESLPPNATVEQLQAALNSKKPTCAGINLAYVCGNHDTAPAYGGEIISVNAGDEVAMNTMIISIVDIDGSGNGSGLIKVPMMNNIKLGVTLSGIKVAEGGCIVAGKAELSGIDVAILTEKQRVTLEKAYTAYNQILDVAYENAGAIAETYNSLAELLQKTKEFTQNYKGSKTEAAKAKALQQQIKRAQQILLNSPKVPEELKQTIASTQDDAQIAWNFFKTGQPCTASGNSGGGNSFFRHQLADCAEYSRLIEAEMQAMEAASLEIDCNCVGTPSDCNDIINIMYKIKAANASENKLVTFYKNILLTDYRNEGISGLTGIDIAGKCYHLHIENNFSTGTINLDMADFQIDKTSQTIHIKDKNGIVAVSIHRLPKTRGTFDELVAYLGFGAKKPDDGGYTPPQGAVDVSLLNISPKGKEHLSKHEGGCVLHVYNDYKGAKSDFCKEHFTNGLVADGHKENAKWISNKCEAQNHYAEIKKLDIKGYGNPTIGVGYMISNHAELEKYCLVKENKLDSSGKCNFENG